MGTPSVSVFFPVVCLGAGGFAGDGVQRTPGGAVQGVPSGFSLVTKKQKSSKSDDFEDFWHAVRDSNPRPSGP